MALILEDEHLESLQCSRCRKYLSVFPVKNHPNREVTCGRCSGIDADQDDSVRSTLYELIAEKYLFKCVNRYEGCRKLLRATETEAHETKCLGNRFDCPKCDDGDGMTVLELIWHYRLRHASSYLKKNSFVIKPSSDDVMLYVQEDFVFFISMRYESNALYLCAMTLTDVKATQVFAIKRGPLWEKSIKKPCTIINALHCDSQVFNLDSIESIEVIFNLEVLKSSKLYEILIPTIPSTSKSVTVEQVECVDQVESMKVSTMNVSIQSIDKTFKVKLPRDLEVLGYRLTDCGMTLLNNKGDRFDLTCSNCKQFIGLPIFKCNSLNHVICYDCQAWCGICDSSATLEYSNDVFKRIIFYLKFPCRWKCGEYFNTDLRLHENCCKLKIFKCPFCPFEANLSSLEFIDLHLLDGHQVLNFIGEYNVREVLTFFNQTQIPNSELSFLFCNKFCYLKRSDGRAVNRRTVLYDFNFGLLGNESNLKLDMIYNKFNKLKRISDEVTHESFSYIMDCLPYINFNYTK